MLPAQDGAVVDFFIVYTHQVSQLTTVKSQATRVPVQVVYPLGFVLLYGVYPKAEITSAHVLNVQVQLVYQFGFVLLYGVYHNVDIICEQVLIVPVQVVYQALLLRQVMLSQDTNVPVQVVNQLSLDNSDTQVGIVGVQVKSQYFPLVATVHRQLDSV